jgi:hypothetical protein
MKTDKVHHHIGGLEINSFIEKMKADVHHHIGGLEIKSFIDHNF